MIASRGSRSAARPQSNGHGVVFPRWLIRLRVQDGAVSADRMNEDGLCRCAEALAGTHRVAQGRGRGRLRSRFRQNGRVLAELHRLLTRAAADGHAIPPLGAWLLDHYDRIDDQRRVAGQQLAGGCDRGLPRLCEGPARGMPRVYDLALQLVHDTDGQLAPETVQQFVSAYQQAAPLNLGELWAIPAMLRLALLEHLRRLGLSITRHEPEQAPGERVRAGEPLAMRNSLASLRELEAMDWKQFVESQSRAERILRQDPAEAYARMSFATRDRYGHAIEVLARRSDRSEEEVARSAVECAAAALHQRAASVAHADAAQCSDAHVGYYLADRGRALLEAKIGYRRSWKDMVASAAGRAPLAVYLGSIVAVWALSVAGAAAVGVQLGAPAMLGPGLSLGIAALFALAAAQFAGCLVNWLCTLILPPRWTMRMDFSAGIPREHRTLVAVPAMLSSQRAAQAMVDHLELRYLANRDDNLLLALLTDLPDAHQETLPSDAALLELVRAGIERLNARYSGGRKSTFFLLHRPRTWNARQGLWMGHERKRGKLAALNFLVRTGSAEAFGCTAGDLEEISSVRYVITLDSDTWLPRDSARELAGCMAHPLNRPLIDPCTRMVVQGHAILQPRVGTTIPEARRTGYSRLMACDAGMDPYTGQSSDVYQDAFDQGSFIGKGIYDVDAFETCLAARFPDNRVLSHDLIEGCFARSGLIDDVELFEGCPASLLAEMSRQHRWIRGDWQIAAWLRHRMPSAHGAVSNVLGGLSRWKIFDNLQRSLAPLFFLGFLTLGWVAAPELAGFWTLLGLALALGPCLIRCLPGLLRKAREKPWLLHLRDQSRGVVRTLAREGLALAILPYRAHCHLDSIMRTLWRLHVSRTNLLEWTTASDAEARSTAGCRDHYEVMWAGTVVSLGLAAALAASEPAALFWAGPVLLAWLAAPWIAWRLSLPQTSPAERLDAEQSQQVRRWARQTWYYFETCLCRRHHCLLPDNVQDRAGWAIAPRTSPTNVGFGLLADLAACDLGYLPPSRLLRRAGATLESLGRLERWRGHFFNWYDTRTLKAAEPRYVSTVDSGNLWAALSIFHVGLTELKDRPLVGARLAEGIQDTLAVIAALRAAGPRRPAPQFDARLTQLHAECAGRRFASASDADRFLEGVCELAAGLWAAAPADAGLKRWTRALRRQCSAAARDLSRLAFWTRVPRRKPVGAVLSAEQEQALARLRDHFEAIDGGCTLAQLPRAAEEAIRLADELRASLGPGSAGRGGTLRLLRSRAWRIRRAAEKSAAAACKQLRRIDELGRRCQEFSIMDFHFLFHPRKKILAVGLNVSHHRRDDSYYDLLASESRLTSYLAVSHRQLAREHWFALGRTMTLAGGKPALLSWSGSMFEYLMPMLIMPSYASTILDSSCRAAVHAQVDYGRRQGMPWGISESCYHATNEEGAYRYRAFGAPGLRLERRTDPSLVVAPYASAMAVMIAPREACANLSELERSGFLCDFGFYDAIDYTPQRRLSPEQPAPCRTVMAHHSGMALLAFVKVLLDGPMQRRFLADPVLRAHDLLLQERMPEAVCPVDSERLGGGPAEDQDRHLPAHSGSAEPHVVASDRFLQTTTAE